LFVARCRQPIGDLPIKPLTELPVVRPPQASAGIDLGLHLVGRFTDEMTARLVQARLEYDPEPLGRIDWSLIDRDVLAPMIKLWVTNELADRPDLQSRLGM
jgi:hypothetical protein